jgi:hydroxymethylbilane synthase
VRTEDAEAFALVHAVDDAVARAAVTAERSFERRLGGGCHAAVAALGEVNDDRLRLRGLVADPAGGSLFRGEIDSEVSDPESTGLLLADRLIEQGAGALLEATA